ncbi:ABC transporter permease [Sporosalibacterium faouarense]|uniref:ABC transporter permease n=1 Tax=Sporosalibacterium faouarense TaxID=516123 RepID=UPI00141CCE3F|nr:ABC transporter permease [Sporosalibacterium faouarense]MTI49641.1 ABC transporter permease [Bacillota bacterium]
MLKVKDFFQDFRNLLIINILDIRTTWIFQMIFGLFTPLGLMFFLKFYVDLDNAQYVTKILSGNIIISMTMPILLLLSSRIAILKKDGSIDYYRTLPISMHAFVISLLVSLLIAYTPSIVFVFILGKLFLGVTITGVTTILSIILTIMLAVISLIGIASFIGWKAKEPQHANAIGNILFTIMIALSPVIIPDDRIPMILAKTSYLFPVTYSSKLLGLILNNNFNMMFYRYIIILLGFAIVSCYILKRVWD